MLEPEWLTAHGDDFDVLHLQFGFDAQTPDQLREVVRTARSLRKPLVYTVHDLRNPHHASRREHDAQLDVLIPGADALITLTDGAADEIHARWNRRPRVLPHPHVVDLDTMRTLQHDRSTTCRRGPFRVGMHVKSLRACMDPLTVLPALIRAIQQIPDGVLQVNGHRDVLEPGGAHHDRQLADALAAAPECVEVRVHDFLTDAELWKYLSSLDVSVLPYRFGTHSGWLEACRDLGTAVVAPSCGYYRDQGPVREFVLDEERFDEGSLIDAIQRAYDARPAVPVSVEARIAQRDEVASAHAELYSELLRGTPCGSV